MSAFSMYPMLVIVFFTKMKALQTFFAKTPYSMYFAMITEGHDYHVYAGHYIAFDVPLSANDTTALTLGITMQAGTIIAVQSTSTSTTFSVYGSEIT